MVKGENIIDLENKIKFEGEYLNVKNRKEKDMILIVKKNMK